MARPRRRCAVNLSPDHRDHGAPRIPPPPPPARRRRTTNDRRWLIGCGALAVGAALGFGAYQIAGVDSYFDDWLALATARM